MLETISKLASGHIATCNFGRLWTRFPILRCALVDVAKEENGRCPRIDGFHETWPKPEYFRQIVRSFSAFLEQILRTRRSLYWIPD